MPLGSGIDRPVLPSTERKFARYQRQHLCESAITGAALDLRHRKVGVLLWDHDRGAQPCVLIEPFTRDSIIHGTRHGSAQILTECRLHAKQSSRRIRVPRGPADPL